MSEVSVVLLWVKGITETQIFTNAFLISNYSLDLFQEYFSVAIVFYSTKLSVELRITFKMRRQSRVYNRMRKILYKYSMRTNATGTARI